MKYIFAIFLCIITSIAFAQLDKGIFLVGGTGNFLASNYEYEGPFNSFSSKKIDINLSSTVGYFVADKIAIGLKTGFSKYKEQVNLPGAGYANMNRLKFGPFARYYFLEKDLRYNILADISYQYGIYRFKPSKGNIMTFNANLGSVMYFNTSVGLEFLLGYYATKENFKQNNDNNIFTQKGFQVGIGFQIHLSN